MRISNIIKNVFESGRNEKKVEYIELIYDLIFVYVIGRNNRIIEHVEEGFIAPMDYLTFFLTTFILLQIWYLTTLFINRYGTNGVVEHILMLVNMFLLYFIGVGTTTEWYTAEHFLEYNIAWALILINIGVQYLVKYTKADKAAPWEAVHIKKTAMIIIAQAAAVLLLIPAFFIFGLAITPLAVLVSFFMMMFDPDMRSLKSLDFEHLTERVMLYVVFSFGEMVVATADYFDDGFSLNNLYYSVMVFTIMAGLFLSYGFMYDNIIDRKRETDALWYMFVHVFMIIAMSNITVALVFMRRPEIAALPKNIFMVVSLAAYYICMFLTGSYAKRSPVGDKSFVTAVVGEMVGFVILILLFYKNSRISVAITMAFVIMMLLTMTGFWTSNEKEG